MAGEIQLGGTSFASESSGTITVNNGTLGSSVVFPTGTVINAAHFYEQSQPSGIETTNTAMQESGIEISLTTKQSSSNSFIVIQFFSGKSKNEGSTSSHLKMTCARATATSTTYASATDLSDDNGSIFNQVNSTTIQAPISAIWIDESHSASTTYFYQIYFCSSGGNTVALVRPPAVISMLAYEIKK
jgi:hypothetical protein